MERLDARTASFFTIGLLVFSFGCKGAGGALKAISAGAKVAVATAAVVSAVQGPSGSRSGSGSGSREVEGEPIPVAGGAECRQVCPVVADGRRVYVCAHEAVATDAVTGAWRRVYICPEPDAVANR